MQIKEVKVCFDENEKGYSFDCSDVYVNIGDKVVVDTSRGQAIGTICSKVKFVSLEDLEFPLKKVIRLATQADIAKLEENNEKAKEIRQECQTIANSLALAMKVVRAEINLDASKVVICFTADDRVDFRELVKVLANKFKMRIELKQIDAREEAKVLGGLGPCGRECCCSYFLSEPTKSSIKMAKTQGMSLSPTSVSGLCGKLKCCLAYENSTYSEIYKKMPKINTEVQTPDGKGLVIYNNILAEKVTVKFLSEQGVQNIKEYGLAEIKLIGGNNDK